ncbi:hypothetical protein COY87_03115, partial [Candidatus Roizmanbacteria bacterium CG_4_10_14_0_8_um_filter_33_9]
EEQAVIVAIQTGKDIPLELADAVRSLQEKGVIQAGRAVKAPREPKPVKEKAPVGDLRPGERISERGITLSKSSIVKVRPYMVSYMTGQKRVVKTFDNIEEARRRYDIMVEVRKGGAQRRGELPEELQPSQTQKAEAHQIAQQKNITPRQYKRIAQVYTGVDSMRKMTPEQATKFIDMLKAFKPKFGGGITIPRTQAVVQAEEAERIFKSASLLDIFRSPKNAFRRMGLEKEIAPVFKGFQLFRDFINTNYSKISRWQRELGVKTKFIFFNKKAVAEQSKRLFRAINNRETEGLNENEALIVERARNLADEIADLVDDARAEVGLDPMNRRENYITNLLTEESRILLEKNKQAPNELYALLSERLPASVFDRLLLQRKGGLPIKEDFWAALKAMVRVHGKYINLYPPVHTFERFMRFFGDKIPVLTRVYVRGRINRFLGRPGRVDTYLKNVDRRITEFLQKIPGLSKEVEIEFQNGMTEIIEAPRIVSKVAQRSLRYLKSIRYAYDLAYSVSFYTLNLTQFWINTTSKLRGNMAEVYRSAFKGYGLMLMDFFRPSRWEFWREKGVLTEVDQIIDNEFSTGSGGVFLNLFAKLSEFNNRVASDIASSENMKLLAKHGKFE